MEFNDVLKKSVTSDDGVKATQDGPLTVFLGPTGWSSYLTSGLLDGVKGATGLPQYGARSADVILAETPLIENMWASAVNTAISKQTALGFTIEDDAESTQRIKSSQQIMVDFDGSYSQGLARHLRDFLTTDNGAFIEIVRQSAVGGSRVIGLRHLDSLRCYRTGDPQRPVVYVDRLGYHHLLRADDVIAMSDMPSSRIEMRGFGICAARRAFETILKMVAMETYVREKVSGSRNLAIHIVNGITTAQLESSLISSENAQSGKGFVVYRGSTIIPMLKSESPSVVTIPLAEVPDGFDADSERKDAYLRYANALGVFVGEIQPLSSQGLGTGMQSAILSESAEGRGLAAYRKEFEHQITHRVLPEQTTFKFAVSDMKDRKEKADVLSAWAGALKVLIETQIINANQALNVLVDNDYLPREFLQTDTTAGGVVSDSESITSGSGNRQIQAANGAPIDQEENDRLRTQLNTMKRIGQKLASRRKASYLTPETYVSKPPDTKPISKKEFNDLMRSTRANAQRIARQVLNGQ